MYIVYTFPAREPCYGLDGFTTINSLLTHSVLRYNFVHWKIVRKALDTEKCDVFASLTHLRPDFDTAVEFCQK